MRGLCLLSLVGCASATSTQDLMGDAHPPIDAHGTGTDGSSHADAALHDGASVDTPTGSCTTPASGVLATWTFAGQPGSQTSTPAASSATGITAGAITRAVALTAVATNNSMSSSGWATTAQPDSAKFYTLTITPHAGCALDLTSLAIDALKSGTGPVSGSVATSADSFVGSTPVSTTAPSTPALAVSGATGAVELRIYGYAATSASGTLRLQTTLTVSGSQH